MLWTDDVHAAVATLSAQGVPVLTLRAAWLADPDGNPVQLVTRRA